MFVETSAPKYEENKEIVVKKITLSQEVFFLFFLKFLFVTIFFL